MKRTKEEKRPQSSMSIIWFFLKPYKLRIVVLFILAVLVGGLEAATIAAIYPILGQAFGAEAGGSIVSTVLGAIANLLPIADEFIAFSVLFLLFAIFTFIVKLIAVKFSVNLSATLVRKNQSEVYSRFIRADYQYFIDHKQGELIYNVATAPQHLAGLVNAITQLTSQAILSISVLLLLFSLSWQGTLAVLAIGVGYFFFNRYLGKKVTYYAAKGELEAGQESNVLLNESITGIKQVKVFAAGEHWIDRFNGVVKRLWYHHSRRAVWAQIPTIALMLILYLVLGAAALIIKVIAPASFAELIPALGTFALAIFRLFHIMGGVGGLIMSIMGALPSCEAVYAIRSDTLTHLEDGEKELDAFKSNVEFNNVSFAYKGRAPVLKDVSITFEKGKTTAIVGRSGVGKTTFINLLLRFFDVDGGEIRIDGSNIKEYKLSSWLNKIGFVSQDTFIFNDSAKNNITFRSEEYSDEELIKAAKYADAHSFITELPEGYDTIVGDKGMRLSGGQAQRIAVARAMLREPEILIFDEATNALDSISEEAVQNAINEISKEHTVIIIAHRLSTIANADKIIVLEDGQIVEEGKHKELMQKRGTYWELYENM